MDIFGKRQFFRADMAGLGKYHTGGYGRIGVYRIKLTSFVKETADSINKIQDITTLINHTLLTIDVSSLYTNMPRNKGIKACKESLLSRSVDNQPTWLINTLSKVHLKFEFFQA